jgi:hypothetical protein
MPANAVAKDPQPNASAAEQQEREEPEEVFHKTSGFLLSHEL